MKKNQKHKKEFLSEAWKEPYRVLPDEQIEKSWKVFRGQILKETPTKGWNYFFPRLVAAVVILFISTSVFLEVYNPTVHVINNTQAHKEVNLPDGSLVLLKQGSKLSYRKYFKASRKVRLEGQAFFDVVRDTLHKFQVETNSLTTTVLGTSFTVTDSYEQSNVNVSLYTGKINVAVNGKDKSYYMVPGESFTYKNGHISIENFNTELSFDSGVEYIDVNYLSLGKVLDFLERRFEYSVERDSELEKKKVTLRINKSDSLEQIITLLSIINKTNYEVSHKLKQVKIQNN